MVVEIEELVMKQPAVSEKKIRANPAKLTKKENNDGFRKR